MLHIPPEAIEALKNLAFVEQKLRRDSKAWWEQYILPYIKEVKDADTLIEVLKEIEFFDENGQRIALPSEITVSKAFLLDRASCLRGDYAGEEEAESPFFKRQ